MARRFVMLAWDCPGCGTENAGPRKFCFNCGAPQPENVRFHEPSGGYKDVTDPKEIDEAMRRPDVHCPFCGTRNAHGTKKCTQCGGKLVGGKQRKVGDNLSTDADEGVETGLYPVDEDEQTGQTVFTTPASTLRSQQLDLYETPLNNIASIFQRIDSRNVLVGIGIAAVLVFISWFVYMKWINVTEVPVTLQSFSWEIEVHIGEIFTYHEEGWSVPPGGRQTSSEQKATGSYEQKQVCEMVDVPKSERYVCGSHIEDRGNGYGERVDDYCTRSWTEKENQCHQENDTSRPIKDTWYHYDIDRWTQTRTVQNSGNGNKPEWPTFILSFGESEGIRSVRFVINYIDELGEPHIFTSFNPLDWDWFTSLFESQVCYAKRNGFGDLNEGIDCSVRE